MIYYQVEVCYIGSEKTTDQVKSMDYTDLYAYQLESRSIEVQKSGIEDVSYVEMRALSRV